MKFLAKTTGAILCGLCLVAFAAPTASAVTLHECKEAVGTGVAYSDSACSTKSESGKFQTVPIPVNTSVGLTFTATSSAVLSTTVAGVKFAITCTGGSGSGTARNVETGGVMKVIGSEGHVKFEGCAVTTPAGGKCTVPATLETNTVKSETSEMNDVISPAAGTAFITIPVSGAECPAALKGSKEVAGKASGVNTTGTTTEFTTTSGSALTFGGQTATLTGSTHSKVTTTGVRVGLLTP
jgi:hypothetical protein